MEEIQDKEYLPTEEERTKFLDTLKNIKSAVGNQIMLLCIKQGKSIADMNKFNLISHNVIMLYLKNCLEVITIKDIQAMAFKIMREIKLSNRKPKPYDFMITQPTYIDEKVEIKSEKEGEVTQK